MTALDAAPTPPTPTRAQIRLELVGIVTAVDNNRIDADEAVALLQALHARILHPMDADLDQTAPAR
ncbi:hypothetical protein [Rathayibacter festucae]|uniref:hypothetical protein n=1 Tax=Rathayibacter festucae TaxID=110937 RepID=UPI002A6AEDA7|nr:hypothetical protein [Rathayibacter festucae]MDY0914515.1 hypothetical protein [Rathayibacter festucae]